MLRINTSRRAAEMLLEPLFLRYLRRYPRVELEIATEEALIDVLGQGFDAGVRLADTVPPDMIAVPILPPSDRWLSERPPISSDGSAP